MSVPAELRYTPEHEWVSVEGTSASVGITEYAAQQLGDVVFVSLPAPGTTVTAGNVSFTAYFYPAPANGFFLRGGLGFADYKEEGSSGSTGFGFSLGMGYDVRVGTNFSLTPVANFSWGSVGDVQSGPGTVPGAKENVFQIGLGFTWH